MELTLNQQQALKVMQSGTNVFLSGAAGSGKSNLISKYIEKNKDKNIMICAPASITDVTFGSDTLRSVFGMPAGVLKVGDFNPKPCEALKRADIVIIDKINLCRIDVFEYAIMTLQNLKTKKEQMEDTDHYKKQIILVGDFHQLLPVLKHEDRADFIRKWGLKRETDLFAFNSSLWDELALESIILENLVDQNNHEKCMTNQESYEADAEPSRTFVVVSGFYHDITRRSFDNPYSFKKISAKDYSGWNSEEDAMLQDEWSRGFGIDEISRNHGRTVGAIRARLIQI